MLTTTCRHCGKVFSFSPTGTRSAVVRQFSDRPAEKRDYFPVCPHCQKPNVVTLEKRS